MPTAAEKFQEITKSKDWVGKPEIKKAAKLLQETDPLAWWITVENFRKVHAHFKQMTTDDTVKLIKKDVTQPEGSVWEYIKQQETYPYGKLKDLSLNEVFEADVSTCATPEAVLRWTEENKGHANQVNILNKVNTYSNVKKRFGKGVNAYDMTNYCTIPSTRKTGLGIAMHMHTENEIKKMVKKDKSVQPQVMLSHAWTEDMDEVMGILEDCVKQEIPLQDGSKFNDQTRVWFCCFAIYQPFKFNDGPRKNEEEVGNVMVYTQMNLNGFEVVSKEAKDMIVIHTTKGDVYARMWCIVELWGAIASSKTIHMIGSKEYFFTYMSKVGDKYFLKGHPDQGREGRRGAISEASGKEEKAAKKAEGVAPDGELPNFQEFLVDFSKSEAGGNKVLMEAELARQMTKINEGFGKEGGRGNFAERYTSLSKTLEGELAGEEGGEEYDIYEDDKEEDGKAGKAGKDKANKFFRGFFVKDTKRAKLSRKLLKAIRKKFRVMKSKAGDIKDDGVTFVEDMVAFNRMKWLQNVAKSYDPTDNEFKLPHWKILGTGTMEAEKAGKDGSQGILVKPMSIDISGHRSSSGGYQISSFPRLANSLAQATDNMIAHSEQLEDELASKEAIITSQEQRIQNQNARIAALERQATRAAPTRRVTANTRRTTARNRNADEEQYYC